MGYSTSRFTLEAMLGHLEDLEYGRECVWNVPAGAAHFAYKIREALWIAAQYPDKYPDLAAAHRDFTIKVMSSRAVRAVRKIDNTISVMRGDASRLNDSLLGDPPRQPAVRNAGQQTLDSVLETVLEDSSLSKYVFDQANLPSDDLLTLYHWAQAEGKIFFVALDGTITIQDTSPDLVDLAWCPEDLEENVQ
jgi:hypothetical protein